MQRLFFGIYGAILASTLLVLAVSYFALSSFNQYRYERHLQQVLSGTAHLLSSGVLRQQAADRPRWISLASSLLDAQLTLQPADERGAPQTSVHKIQLKNGAVERFVFVQSLPTTEQQLVLEFDGLTEHIVTATAFFMLNELGRLPVEQRQQAFDTLSQKFAYDVFRVPRQDLVLDSRQLDRLDRGETIVEWRKQFGQGSAINVYAPWGNTQDVLALGPIAFFDPYPPHIIAIVLGAALLLMAGSVMLIIRGVANRLVLLQHKVDAISPEYLPGSIQAEDEDVISELNSKIQNMAERIKKLLEEKAHMIRAVSHDLRTPIAKIHFRLESLAEQLGHEHPMLKSCHGDLKQLNALIDELLTYEKLSVKQEIQFQTLDLPALLAEQLEGARIVYPELQWKFNPLTAINCSIEGNEILLQRLFENLLNNAGRYARERVILELDSDQSSVIITVDDDGQGLDKAHIPHLFEPFFRAEASRSRTNGGYGMGLAIVKQVARQHDATITASNNAWGGARFTLSIPCRRSQDA